MLRSLCKHTSRRSLHVKGTLRSFEQEQRDFLVGTGITASHLHYNAMSDFSHREVLMHHVSPVECDHRAETPFSLDRPAP